MEHDSVVVFNFIGTDFVELGEYTCLYIELAIDGPNASDEWVVKANVLSF